MKYYYPLLVVSLMSLLVLAATESDHGTVVADKNAKQQQREATEREQDNVSNFAPFPRNQSARATAKKPIALYVFACFLSLCLRVLYTCSGPNADDIRHLRVSAADTKASYAATTNSVNRKLTGNYFPRKPLALSPRGTHMDTQSRKHLQTNSILLLPFGCKYGQGKAKLSQRMDRPKEMWL